MARYVTWISVVCLLVFAAACSDDTSGEGTNNSPSNNGRLDPDANPFGGDADASGDTNSSDDAGSDVSAPDIQDCTPGQVLSCADDHSLFRCKQDGTGYAQEACASGETCLQGQCGDQVCVPNTQHCADPNTLEVCNADGTGYEDQQACPANTVCEQGACKTPCDLGGKGPSYIGCEYWSLDLDQYHDPTTNPKPDEVPHAVVISNPGISTATITFESRSTAASFNIPDPTVPPGSAKAFTMPRLDVSGTGTSLNSIHVMSSVPVIAHQFNPLNNSNVYSNDASLLLPANTLGNDYYVLDHPTQVLPCILTPCPESQHAYVTVVAAEPGTTKVRFAPTADIKAGAPVGRIPAGTSPNRVTNPAIELQFGEVLNLEAEADSPTGANDLTGTHIFADKKIAVFAGHEEAVISSQSGADNNCCADHLEQQLFPVNTWSTDYVATFSPGRGTKVDQWKIVAGEDNVTITTDPVQSEANNVTLDRGEFVSFFSDQSFEIHATGKIMVGQFLVSQEQTSEVVGDPAFILAVPTAQYRDNYHLLTPDDYSHDYVTITRPAGATVNLDGTAVADAEFSPVGAGTWEVAAVEVQPGVHVLDGAEPFGIAAYGFDSAVSYGYPGGLNLVSTVGPSNP